MPEGCSNLRRLSSGPLVLLDLLVTVGITIRQVLSAYLTVLLRFLKLLFELSHLFRQVCHLSRLSTSWFVPGFLCRVKGLGRPVLLAAVCVELTTLCGVVGREQPVHSLASFAKLVGTSLLGGLLLGPSPMRTLSLPGYMLTCLFDSCCDLGLVDSGSFVCLFGKKFLEWLSEIWELTRVLVHTGSSTQLGGGSV